MSKFFENIESIKYEGPDSNNPLSYHYYDPDQLILGKTMAEHLRLGVCMWHTFCWHGEDMFGNGTFNRKWFDETNPMKKVQMRVNAAFEFFEKLGVPYFTFHDFDMAPQGKNLKESGENLKKMIPFVQEQINRTGIYPLFGSTNLFSHRRFMSGAATNPNPEMFAFAVAQTKDAFDFSHQLGAKNFTLWGGREGYSTLLNTDLKQESDQMGRFLSMLADYKHKIGFKGGLLLEPKPAEPSKHQYDHDSATVYAFLQKYGLEKEFKVNIEANHATLAGHSFLHEVSYAIANDIFGSIDANRGDPQLGWDTDQFPIDNYELTLITYTILKNGGFTTGGYNFDSKLRRESIDLEDLFHGHIAGIDALARSLINAATILENDFLHKNKVKRYEGWQSGRSADILAGRGDFEEIAKYAVENNLNPEPVSARQEILERLVTEAAK